MRVRHRSCEASVWNCPTPPRIARDQLWQRPLLAGLQPAESKEVFIDC